MTVRGLDASVDLTVRDMARMTGAGPSGWLSGDVSVDLRDFLCSYLLIFAVSVTSAFSADMHCVLDQEKDRVV